jgi:cephalosporin-C deacetylase-like acetyl esterase
MRNRDLHRDLEIDTVDKEIKRYARKHDDRLHQHTNFEALQFLDNSDIVRRLKRVKRFELV